MIEFDASISNPPFEDITNRKKTPHKLWIDFTHEIFRVLKVGGEMGQISPNSFLSPSSKILPYLLNNDTKYLGLDTEKFFNVNSTFADYVIKKGKSGINTTFIERDGSLSSLFLDKSIYYLPSDFCAIAASIHKKVMFNPNISKLNVKFDYVTCHNVLLKDANSTISRTMTSAHQFPIFHTNPQIWYSSIRQSFAGDKKVMWTRSGYTKPFYDDGVYGTTDMGYYVSVPDDQSGLALSHNLNSILIKYIFDTAKWSGFGNELVFKNLPVIPLTRMTDSEIFKYFSLTAEEIAYVVNFKANKKSKKTIQTLVTITDRSKSRVRQTAEIFTCDELADRLIDRMDIKIFTDPSMKILEPAAGNGQLVLSILRKMRDCGRNDWAHILQHQLYICEYMKDNVEEMLDRLSEFTGLDVRSLKHNIIWSDFLKFIKNEITYQDWTKYRYNNDQSDRIIKVIDDKELAWQAQGFTGLGSPKVPKVKKTKPVKEPISNPLFS